MKPRPPCQRCGKPVKRPGQVHCSWACRYENPRKCPDCGGRRDNGAQRCPECRQKWIAGRIEDIEWLLSFGEDAQRIAARLGQNPATIARWLARHDRNDLARPFWHKPRQEAA